MLSKQDGRIVVIGIARLALVVAAVIAFSVFGEAHGVAILTFTLTAIVLVSLIPVRSRLRS